MSRLSLRGGGAKSSHRARLRPSKTIKKFSSLEVEKELKITSLLGNVHLSRSNPERILQLKTGVPPCPIIAPTSQVGEVAVVRTPVSYKCGWGSDKTNPHPNLPGVNILVWYVILQAGCIYPWKACACVIQLAHFPRSFGKREEFVSEPCELRNSGEGLKNHHSKHYPPTPFGYCLRFAPRSQNLTFGAEHLSVRFARYPDYLTNVRVVRPQIRFPHKGGRGSRAQLMLNRIAVIQSPMAIQGRRISKTFSNPITDTSKMLSSRTCFGILPTNKELDPSPEFLSFAPAQLEILPVLALLHALGVSPTEQSSCWLNPSANPFSSQEVRDTTQRRWHDYLRN